jgi:hypothetical protein
VPSLCRVHNERLTRVAKKIKTFWIHRHTLGRFWHWYLILANFLGYKMSHYSKNSVKFEKSYAQ